MQPYDADWKREWNSTIGGSRSAAILGVSRFQSPLTVYRQMFEGAELPDLENSPDIRRGRLLEPIARMLMEDQAKVTIEPHDQCAFVYNPLIEFAHCLPDGWDEKRFPCELKVPRPATWQKAYLNGVPQDWMCQLQHTMAVLNCDAIHWACLNPVTMDLLYSEVARDDSFIAHLMDVEEQFYADGKAGKEPSDTDLGIEEIPKTEGRSITLTGAEAIDAARLLHEGQELAAEAEEICKSAKARLCKLANEARVAEILEGSQTLAVCHNIQVDGPERLDKKAVLAAYPDAVRFVKKGSPYTQFRMYWRGDRGTDE